MKLLLRYIMYVSMMHSSYAFCKDSIEIPVSMVAKLIMMRSPGADIENQILERTISFREEADRESSFANIRWCLVDKSIHTDLMYLAQHANNQDGLLNKLLLEAVRYRQYRIVDALLANRYVDVNYHDQDGYSVISLSSQDPQLLKKLLDCPRVSRETIQRSSIVQRASNNFDSLRVLFSHQRISNEIIETTPLPGMSILFNLLSSHRAEKLLPICQVEALIFSLIQNKRLKRETFVAQNAWGENILFFADKSLPLLQELLKDEGRFSYNDVSLKNCYGETLLHAYIKGKDFLRAYQAIKIVLSCNRFDKKLLLHRAKRMTPYEKLESTEKKLLKNGISICEKDVFAIQKLKSLFKYEEQTALKMSRL